MSAAQAGAAAASAASAAARGAAARPGPTLSSAVRAVLREAGEGAALRLPTLWASVRARAPLLAGSKTHFRRKIVRAMERRGDLVKTHVFEREAGAGAGAAPRDFFAFRLKRVSRNFPRAGGALPALDAAAAPPPPPPLR